MVMCESKGESTTEKQMNRSEEDLSRFDGSSLFTFYHYIISTHKPRVCSKNKTITLSGKTKTKNKSSLPPEPRPDEQHPRIREAHDARKAHQPHKRLHCRLPRGPKAIDAKRLEEVGGGGDPPIEDEAPRDGARVVADREQTQARLAVGDGDGGPQLHESEQDPVDMRGGDILAPQSPGQGVGLGPGLVGVEHEPPEERRPEDLEEEGPD
jgi:hypothetical protein